MAFGVSSKDKRREDRSTAGLEVTLVLYDNRGEKILAGPSVAFIKDISRFGVGLILPQIRIGSHHLFYGPNDKSSILYLEKACPDGSRTLSIQVQPKWYRLGDDEERRCCHLGIEFIKARNVDDISQLRNMAKELVVPEKNWLSSIFSK